MGQRRDESVPQDGEPAPFDRPVGTLVDHVGVLVRDIDGALAFFTDKLGNPLIHREELTEIGVRVAYVDAGNVLIQLVQPLRPGVLTEELAQFGEGIHHLCFRVEDIPAVLERLAPDADIPVVLGGRGRRACFLPERPGGLRVELTERLAWSDRSGEADRRPGEERP